MSWLILLTLPALAFAARPGVSRSRRLLASTLVILVPIAGPILALLVRRTKGGGVELEPETHTPIRRLSLDDVSRLGEVSPALDRLLIGDPGERLEALVGLSSAGDATAVAVLRWALEHGPSDVVLDAALTLEEIDLRGEARMVATREELAERHCVEVALAAADAAAAPVLNRIADPSISRTLADQARGFYQAAIECGPERRFEIEEKLARLELAAERPRAALEILSRLLLTASRDDHTRLTELRDDAAFAAREFEQMSFRPTPLEVPKHITARMLQTVPSS
jgi:hypothetical protein